VCSTARVDLLPAASVASTSIACAAPQRRPVNEWLVSVTVSTYAPSL
jgi:hypothetical protein